VWFAPNENVLPLPIAGVLLAASVLHGCARTTAGSHLPSQAMKQPVASAPRDLAEAPGPSAGEPGATEAPTAEDEADRPDAIDDSGEAAEPESAESLTTLPHPLDGLTEAQIAAAVRRDLASLGSMSIGSPNAGAQLNAVQAQASDLYQPVSPSGSWGTKETLDYLARALRRVHAEFPDAPPLALGDISGRRGGPSPPHISHQSGRDVDIGYFYRDGTHWYVRGTAQNLDLPKNWAFVRALIAETDVDLILIDHSIQVLLEDYARSQGEDPAWLAGVFHGVPGKLRPIIRHAPGHATHIHVRFFNPIAQETARRCYPYLLEAKLTSAPQSYLAHQVKKNETLGMISRKYGVPVPRLRAVNGLKSSMIREKSVIRVPVASRGPARPGPPLRLPARRSPPPPRGAGAVETAAQPPPTK